MCGFAAVAHTEGGRGVYIKAPTETTETPPCSPASWPGRLGLLRHEAGSLSFTRSLGNNIYDVERAC